MTTAEQFELRVDARAHLEGELIIPLCVVLALATIMIFALDHLYPAPFLGMGFFIPWWLDVIAYLSLLAVGALYVQRPKYYEITDDSIDIVYARRRYRIPFTEIKEVQSVAERQARPLDEALLGGTFERIMHGIRIAASSIFKQSAVPLPAVDLNLTTCDIGGVKIICTDGRMAILSPGDLSKFLNESEQQFKQNGIEASVIRQTPVKIG